MSTDSLRPEFVLPGAALLSALTWFVRALDSSGNPGHVWPAHWFQSLSAGGALVILALGLGASYVVGAVLVQLTYEWIACHMRSYERAQLFGDNTPEKLEDLATGPWLSKKDVASLRAVRSVNQRESLKWLPHRVSTDTPEWAAAAKVIDLGRSFASDEVMREVEYRRSNRQVFLGVMPALLLAGLAAAVTLIGSGALTTVVGVLAPAAALLAVYHLFRGAWYQEQRGEQLLFLASILGLRQLARRG